MQSHHPNFFKGWKRKLGVVTLVIAGAFAFGWARSSSSVDFVFCTPGEHTLNLYGSAESSLVWGTYHAVTSSALPTSACWELSVSTKREAFLNLLRNSRFDGFSFSMPTTLSHNALGEDSPKNTFLTAWIIPYWSIVIPLTLLSAYLLLRKSGG